MAQQWALYKLSVGLDNRHSIVCSKHHTRRYVLDIKDHSINRNDTSLGTFLAAFCTFLRWFFTQIFVLVWNIECFFSSLVLCRTSFVYRQRHQEVLALAIESISGFEMMPKSPPNSLYSNYLYTNHLCMFLVYLAY